MIEVGRNKSAVYHSLGYAYRLMVTVGDDLNISLVNMYSMYGYNNAEFIRV